MNTVQISITAPEADQEILISQLEELNAIGFEQTERLLIAYFPENNFEAYEIQELLKKYNFESTTIEEQNWNAVWESNFQPVLVDDFCGIRADFHEPLPDVQFEIVITPKMSFGTGHHATTYMMIRQMRDLDFNGKTVFDFGTGTGVLAILAEKMGAGSIRAIDVDEWSIENAVENVGHNGCKRVEVALSTALPEIMFDVVLANINRNVLLDYMKQLSSITKPGGILLLSGIMPSDVADIQQSARNEGFVPGAQDERNGWSCLKLTRA
jgi:ribosomal protein L11 methyltransferase